MADIQAFSKLPATTQLEELFHVQQVLNQSGAEAERASLSLAIQFQEFRKKGLHLEEKHTELQQRFTKAEAEKNALTVKLKHARRQIEVEIQHRQKVEQERDDLDHQLMLVRDLLFSNPDSGSCGLNEEQQKKLDFLNSSRFQSPRDGKRTVRRLERIDETGSFLSDYSDISFDYTEDDLDATTLRNGKKFNKRARIAQRRALAEEEIATKKFRCEAGEAIHMTVDGPGAVSVEKLEKSFHRPQPHQGRRRPSREHRRRSAGLTSESETASSDVDNLWPTAGTQNTQPKSSMRSVNKTPTKLTGKLHDMQIKPCVITKETCKPCGKRIQFGKKAIKCVDCRLVTHPECESQARNYPCDPQQRSPSTPTSPKSHQPTLDDFITSTESAQIPPIIYHTLHEIENRGLKEVGLYRIPGMVRTVRELKEKFLKNKCVPDLTKVDEVHTLCSLVKDFLRETLPEPLLTFNLHPAFVDAANKDTDAELYQAISELPKPNLDTLAFVMLHLQRVVDTPENSMSHEALSKAMGPSLIGFSTAEPSMQELQTAASYQERVMTRLLNLPHDYYSKFIKDHDNDGRYNYRDPQSMLGPIGISPRKTPSSSSLAERAKKYLHGTPFGKSGKRKEGGTYFSSPTLQ